MADPKIPRRMSRTELAHHIGEWHGTRRNCTPIEMRMQWTREELEAVHYDMHAEPNGPEGIADSRELQDYHRAVRYLGLDR